MERLLLSGCFMISTRNVLPWLLCALTLGACAGGEIGENPALDDVDPSNIVGEDEDFIYVAEADDYIVPHSRHLEAAEALSLRASVPRAQVVYLAFDGLAVTKGGWSQDNAQTNTSFIPAGNSQVPAFSAGALGQRGAVIDAIVAGLREDFAGYEVSFTTARPASGAYTTVAFGGRPAHLGLDAGAIGLAPLDEGNSNQSDIVFVFTEAMADYGYSARGVAWVAAHEFGHSFGLRHLAHQDAIMGATSCHCTQRWAEGNTLSNGAFQRDHDVLASVFSTPSSPPVDETTCGRMDPGASLSRGQAVNSCDGRFRFVHQTDGNVVLYQGGTALWNTGTYNTSTTSLVMQGDGNLVLYGPGGSVHWASNTWGQPGASLAVQSDGNAVLYRANAAIWATNTCCR